MNRYIEMEEGEKSPPQIQCIYERAVLLSPLSVEVCTHLNMLVFCKIDLTFDCWLYHLCCDQFWEKYCRYLEQTLKIKSVSLAAYKRATRNCPWCAKLWKDYMLLLERMSLSAEHKETFTVSFFTFENTFISSKSSICNAQRCISYGFQTASDYVLIFIHMVNYLRRQDAQANREAIDNNCDMLAQTISTYFPQLLDSNATENGTYTRLCLTLNHGFKQ